MNDDFYVAFEEKFRGSEELIKKRQKKYLKFINPLKKIKDAPKALDIGCGRGEWMSLLSENGFEIRGIDINESMVKLVRQKGLNASVNDVLSELRVLEDESLDVITAFQVVEHIKFDDVLELVKEAKRVLSPCGILILETPNPENLMVGTQWFYMDATHKNPIPCELLAFATQYFGLQRNFIFKTNEKLPLIYEEEMSIFDVFEGVSPDYSVIAQKAGEQSELFDAVFAVTPGVNLAQISASYTSKTNAKFNAQMGQILDKFDEITRRYEAAQRELNDILSSKSWRITKPLRKFTAIVKKMLGKDKPQETTKEAVQEPQTIVKEDKISYEREKTLTRQEMKIYDLLKKD